jgi:hypothetical protein
MEYGYPVMDTMEAFVPVDVFIVFGMIKNYFADSLSLCLSAVSTDSRTDSYLLKLMA